MVSDLLQNSIFQVDFRSFKIVAVKILFTSVSRFCKYWLWSSNWWFNWFQFSSVAQSCPTLCEPMNYSMPGLRSITNSLSLPKLMSIESVMPFNHLNLCYPLLLLPSIFPSIRVFPNESVLLIKWPKYWSFSFNMSPSKEQSGLISLGWTGWISLQFKGLSRVFSNTTVQK